ncbi:MAG: caspase family protein [Polyangiales bacterium]
MPTPLPTVPDTFALIIGVGDYRAFDPSGANNLTGARYDVRSMYELSVALGIPQENISILVTVDEGRTGDDAMANLFNTSPTGVHFGPATHDAIVERIAWLSKSLTPAPGATRAPIGLFTFSGHGDFVGGELALCPSDVRPGANGAADPVGAITFASIAQVLGDAAGKLTAILDCCHAGSAEALPRSRARTSLTGRALPSQAATRPFAGHTIAACAAGEQSAQAHFDGIPHGVLTWALKTAIDQWSLQSYRGEAGAVSVDASVTYQRLATAVQALYSALAFPQTMTLAPPSIGAENFFGRRAGLADNPVSDDPTRPRVHVQLDPGDQTYVLYNLQAVCSDGSTHVANFLSVNKSFASGNFVYEAGTEYMLVADGWPAANTGTFLKFTLLGDQPMTWVKGDPDPLAGSVAIGSSTPSWTSATAPTTPAAVSTQTLNGQPLLATLVVNTAASPPLTWQIGYDKSLPATVYLAKPGDDDLFADVDAPGEPEHLVLAGLSRPDRTARSSRRPTLDQWLPGRPPKRPAARLV